MSNIAYVSKLVTLIHKMVEWHEEGLLSLPHRTNSLYKFLDERIGRKWENPEILDALTGPNGWAIFKMLEIQHEQESNSDGTPQIGT